jgi:tetratricopeptide (TPR) repeat protein
MIRNALIPLRIQQLLAELLLSLLFVAGGGTVATGQETTALPGTADTAEGHLGKGYDALKQDRYEVAAREFRAALDIDPKLVLRARFPLAVALFELHKPAEARQELEAVRKEVGDHPNVLYYLGRLDLDDRNFESAIENLGKIVSKPPFPDTAYYLGLAYLRQGDAESAEKWLKEAAQQTPHDSRVQHQLAAVYRKQGREEEAKQAEALSMQQRERDNSESALRLECAQKLDQGLKEEARTVCERMYDPENAEKLTALGLLYAQHGDLEGALKPLRRAAELAPQSPPMQYNLAFTYYQLGRYEDARAPLANAVARWQDLFPLNALYGAVLVKLGEEAPAYEALQRAHRLNPDDAGVIGLLYPLTLELGTKNQTDQKYSDSLRYFAEAAKLRPQTPEPHQHMAQVHKLLGHPDKARAEQREADRLAGTPAR